MSDSAVFVLDVLPDGVEVPSDLGGTMRRVDPDAPLLTVHDAGAVRGDGVFETIGVFEGRPQSLEAHLERLAGSAAMLDLPAPNLPQWRAAALAAAATVPRQRQGALKLVLTRGAEVRAGPPADPTAWLAVSLVADDVPERRVGVHVVTLDRGFSSTAAPAPWLLAGAKTLSYAVNMAALREARRRGADDVVFVSSDGVVLEGPTSSVIARFGDRIVTPDPGVGILAGTSQLSAFDFFEDAGFVTDYARLRADELQASDALWLVSSVRLAVPVVALDGMVHGMDTSLTARLNDWLSERRE